MVAEVLVFRPRANRSRTSMGLGSRARTVNRRHLRVVQDTDGDLGDVIDIARPCTRGDCEDGPRPCPWVSCQYNLYLDVNQDNGSVQFNFSDLEPEDVPPSRSCALDIAELDGVTLEEIGAVMNVTRERIRQIETKLFDKLHTRARQRGTAVAAFKEFADERADGKAVRQAVGRRIDAPDIGVESEPDDDLDNEVLGVRSFFDRSDVDEHGIDAVEQADALVASRVWNMFAKDSNQRGFDARSNQQKAQSRRTRGEEENDMAITKDNITRAHADLLKKLGKPPSAPELFEAMGKDAVSVGNVRQSAKRYGLALTSLRGKVGPGKSSKPAARMATPKPTTAPKPRKPSADPIVTALIDRRDEFRRKADAIDAVIAVVSS